jgi:hypothetical protein
LFIHVIKIPLKGLKVIDPMAQLVSAPAGINLPETFEQESLV